MRTLRRAVIVLLAVVTAVLGAGFAGLFAGSPPAGAGPRDGALAPCPATPNCVSSRASDPGQRIAPIAYTGTADAALARMVRVIAVQPGATIVVLRDGYAHATFRSRWLGFVDDVEVLADPARSVLELRSASRLGRSDFGANRARADRLAAAFASLPP